MNIGNILRRISKVVIWTAGIWLGILIIIQLVVSPKILTNIINIVSDEYIDGELVVGEASVSIFRHFPRITLNLNDVSLTYPSDRFDSLEDGGIKSHLLHSGCGETADTLASLEHLSASISLSALAAGKLKLPHITVVSPRIFAHSYDELNANWNIIRFPDDEETDTDEEGFSLDIILGRTVINGNPRIVYTESRDTLFALIDLKSLKLNGRIAADAIHRSKVNARLDSLFVAGRYGRDTIAIGLDMLETDNIGPSTKFRAQVKTFMATEALGRVQVPVDLCGTVSFPENDAFAVSLHDLKGTVASIPISGEFDAVLYTGRSMLYGRLDIDGCSIEDIAHDYLEPFFPEISEIHTDSRLYVSAAVNGYYDSTTGTMPEVTARLRIPDSGIQYNPFPERIGLGMEANIRMDTSGRADIEIPATRLQTYGLEFNLSGKAQDLTGENPLFSIESKLSASLDSLRRFLPDTLNISADGRITAEVAGSIRLDELDLYSFSSSSLKGNVYSTGIMIRMPEDSIDVNISDLDIKLEPEDLRSRRNPGDSYRLMALSCSLGEADIKFKDAFSFSGNTIDFAAKNSADKTPGDTSDVSYLGGHLNAGMLQMEDSKGTSIKLDNTKNRFQMRPKRDDPSIPVLSLTNSNQRITYITSDNRLILTDSKISAQATMSTLAKGFGARMGNMAFVPRQSRISRNDDEFKSSDIKIDLDETVKKYFREWDMNGRVSIRTGIVMTPYFPLRNILRGAELGFNNNQVAIDSLKVMAGESEICAAGSLSGLRRALLRGGSMKLQMNISSGSVNADELLYAYSVGSKYSPSQQTEGKSSISNADFFKQVTAESAVAEQQTTALFILPGNINADINLDASGIKYKDLNISEMCADIKVKDRCAQIRNTFIDTNMGDIRFDGFYATRSSRDLSTGFCLEMKDVTAERVIGLVPELGEFMPMIGSLNGNLNCEIAATASMDTEMNIVTPSVNGIIRLSGSHLNISDDETFTEIAKKLMFKNKKRGEIESLLVEGSIHDSSLEIFPFMFKIDRYTLGLSGIQNLDMSYKHHVSVLRSPLLIRIGLDISGSDYDNMKFKLGKAKYRINKIPAFSDVIDQTKNELLNSIYNIFDTGVNNTINNSDIHSALRERKKNIGYVNPADQTMEELSDQEISKLQESEATENALEEAMKAINLQYEQSGIH